MAVTDARKDAGERVEHRSVADRAAIGKAARAEVSRSSHGEWAPAPDRPDPVALLEAQGDHPGARARPDPPRAHGGVIVRASYRGAANVMAADLAAGPQSGLRVQLCGDAHLANFGGFASPERSLVFDLNDFDETLPGPFEWDVKRLAASLEIAGREPRLRRQGTGTHRHRVGPVLPRSDARPSRTMQNLDVWYAHLDIDEHRRPVGRPSSAQDAIKNLQRAVTKAESKDRLKAEAKLTESSTASRGSSATHRCSCPSRSSSPRRDAQRDRGV